MWWKVGGSKLKGERLWPESGIWDSSFQEGTFLCDDPGHSSEWVTEVEEEEDECN